MSRTALGLCINDFDDYKSVSERDKLLPNAKVELKERHEEFEQVQLTRYLKLHHGVSIIVGNVIGGTIFITPNVVAEEAGSSGLVLVIWGIGGVIATLGALCFAELGTMLPRSGEKYHYLEEIYGSSVAFSYAWMIVMFLHPGAQAVKCLTFGAYILKPIYSDCEVPKYAVMLLSCNLIMILTYLNCKNIQWVARGQNVLTTLASGSLVVISILGIIYMVLGETKNRGIEFNNTSSDVSGIILGMYTVAYCYAGWNALNFVVEEMENPVRDLPRALCISIAIITALYLTTNVAYIAVLGTEGMAKSEAVAVTFGERIMGPLAWIVPMFVAASVLGSINAATIMTSRMCYVTARKGHLPTCLSLVNVKNLSPVTSVIFQCVLVIAILSIGDVLFIIEHLTILNTIFDGLCVIGLLYWRWKIPEKDRPIKPLLIIPIMYTLMTVGILATTIIWRPIDAVVAIVALLSVIPAYLCSLYGGKIKQLGKVSDHLTRWSALLFFCLPPEHDSASD